jgi:hypothetical protein
MVFRKYKENLICDYGYDEGCDLPHVLRGD